MAYKVEWARPFRVLVDESKAAHPKIEQDLEWLSGRLRQAPAVIGDHVPGLKSLHPVYKTRCKDSCCGIGASGGWRVYYRIDEPRQVVALFFVIHKREAENAGRTFLNQQIERAFTA
jgi:mRNA-degrading endonuclease RelE of RelBE toxin-antitoxin system